MIYNNKTKKELFATVKLCKEGSKEWKAAKEEYSKCCKALERRKKKKVEKRYSSIKVLAFSNVSWRCY